MKLPYSSDGWHRRARHLCAELESDPSPEAFDLAEDIEILLSRARQVETYRELHGRILGPLGRLCDTAETLLHPKIVVGITGASGGIGRETVFQALRSRSFKKVIALVRISGKGPAAGNLMDLSDCLHLDPLDRNCPDIEIMTYDDFAENATTDQAVDVFIHTIGLARKPAPIDPDTMEPVGKTETREELLARNQWVLKGVVEKTHHASPEALNIFVTNPIGQELMQVALDAGVAPGKILGFGGELDSARFRYFILRALKEAGQPVLDVRAQVVGEHNNQMIPLMGSEVILDSGKTLSVERCIEKGLVSFTAIEQAMEQTIGRGGEIVEMQGSSATRAPARGLVVMLENLLRGKTVNGLSFRPQPDGSTSFIGGPVRLTKDMTIEPFSLEKAIQLNQAEQEKWREAKRKNIVAAANLYKN